MKITQKTLGVRMNISLANQTRGIAAEKGLSVSGYLKQLVKKDIESIYGLDSK